MVAYIKETPLCGKPIIPGAVHLVTASGGGRGGGHADNDNDKGSVDPALTCVFFDCTPPTADGAHPVLCAAGSSSSSWLSTPTGTKQPVFWPGLLLQQDFPDATILALRCCPPAAQLRSSSKRCVQAADDLLAALMVVDHEQLVLVGHGFGGLLVKEVCLEIHRRTVDPSQPPADRHHCRAVLASIAGLAFYSTPHKPLPRLAMPEYEYILPDMPAVCAGFGTLCKAYGWRTLGVGAAAQGYKSATVPLHAAAKGMTCFAPVATTHDAVSRPTSRDDPAYAALARFLHTLQHHEEQEDPLAVAPVLAALKSWRGVLSGFRQAA